MAVPETRIGLPKLSRLDFLDLCDNRQDLDIRFDSSDVDERHGGIGLGIAILSVSPLAIAALVAWLTKKRKQGTVKLELMRLEPSGAIEHLTLHLSQSASEGDAEVLSALSDVLRIDLKTIVGKAEER